MEDTPRDPERSRWPGLLLCLFVPGFGLFRAGMPLRGFCWLFGLMLWGVIAVVFLALEAVPVWVVGVVVFISIVAQIWMLRDGFRPGKMTWRLWLLFLGLFALLLVMPNPALSVARVFQIPTGAMQPTLRGSETPTGPDYLVANLLSYRFSEPERGDIIVFSTSEILGLYRFTNSYEERTFVKRLVGMPGETIRIADGKVFANGRPLDEADGIPPFQYENPRPIRLPTAMVEGEDFVIGPDEYFVLGDNTSNSLDSRYWGCVPKSSLMGKATMICYPFARVRRGL